MASLLEGRQYGLSSQGHPSDTKTKLLVKLTDSAHRAIEEYLVFRGNTSKQPTVQFLKNHGVIVFPSSQHPNGEHSFEFSFSATTESESLQGSFECVQQCGPRSLVSLGSMQYKMHINAKEDVYDRTRHRMAVAEEERKKDCTKEIKVGTSVVSRRVKLKKSNVSLPPKASPPYGPSKPKAMPFNGHTPNGYQHLFSKPSSVTPPPPTAVVNGKGNSDILKRSYRERIVHLLALRPYKKPELIARLMKDGIKDKDKKSGVLTGIISAVAVTRENAYSLARHLWNEVQDDWPFYSDADKQLLRSRRPNPATCDEPSFGTVSASSPSPSPSVAPQRRPLPPSSSAHSDPIPTKKQRISHYTQHKSDAPLSAKADSSQHSSHKPDSNFLNGFLLKSEHHHHHQVQQQQQQGNGGHVGQRASSEASRDRDVNRDRERDRDRDREQRERERDRDRDRDRERDRDRDRDRDPTTTSLMNGGNFFSRPDSNGNSRTSSAPSVDKVSSTTNGTTNSWTRSYSPESSDSLDSKVLHTAHSTSNAGALASPSSDPYDYQQKYTRITNQDQRTQYKADFNAEYQEYRKMYAVIIEPVSRKFADLEGILKATPSGTEEWIRIKDQILQEYKENKRNSKYQDARQRFQTLHDKLAHIKQLVLEYDMAQSQSSDAMR